VFLKAIDFAGSYPVLMLWGVAPPLMALIQRSRDDKGTSKFKRTAGPSVWLAVLVLLAIGMIGFSAIGDMASFVNKFKIL
jgi:ammonia channel protein AmtB